ncbi:MAG TPA: PilZ domain-containing protein [Nitrospirae bacterium]|nr:PilZ domain protein [bacterium BMS3Bbin09]HDH34603.1 PilZ domain-containing protein [Nitrospirota bacterium]HDN94716.1 PilZ domain-containing protein [Nitrospirota bacterium]HDO67492.1 PilZ domain-containing protein [Nitrospirota bacterium]HDZ84388.1 PilZ domain-containing protein [Nitrospirota bacterium]
MQEDKSERRRDKRHPANVRTEILYNGRVYGGVIENLSASGAGIVTDQLEKEVDFVQYDTLELKFRSTAGEEFHIKCTIMWASYITPQNLRYRIGLELVGKHWDAISQFL